MNPFTAKEKKQLIDLIELKLGCVVQAFQNNPCIVLCKFETFSTNLRIEVKKRILLNKSVKVIEIYKDGFSDYKRNLPESYSVRVDKIITLFQKINSVKYSFEGQRPAIGVDYIKQLYFSGTIEEFSAYEFSMDVGFWFMFKNSGGNSTRLAYCSFVGIDEFDFNGKKVTYDQLSKELMHEYLKELSKINENFGYIQYCEQDTFEDLMDQLLNVQALDQMISI